MKLLLRKKITKRTAILIALLLVLILVGSCATIEVTRPYRQETPLNQQDSIIYLYRPDPWSMGYGLVWFEDFIISQDILRPTELGFAENEILSVLVSQHDTEEKAPLDRLKVANKQIEKFGILSYGSYIAVHVPPGDYTIACFINDARIHMRVLEINTKAGEEHYIRYEVGYGPTAELVIEQKDVAIDVMKKRTNFVRSYDMHSYLSDRHFNSIDASVAVKEDDSTGSGDGGVPKPEIDAVEDSAVAIQVPHKQSPTEMRTALIIANGEYTHFPNLETPVAEAIALRQVLARLGFETTLLTNATREEILDAIINFEHSLRERRGLAMFHYGGHGVQVNGANFLVPASADIPDERRVRTRGINFDEVVAAMEASGSTTNILILDACRNNPLPSATRSAARGLSVISRQPANSIIVYSAEAGTVAQDGVFTPTLLKYLQKPNLEFTDILRMVRREVRLLTDGAQRPGEYSQLETEIYLNTSPEN